MTKELEALDRNMVVIREKDYAIIEKALQRLEAIDNSNPSEALECLEEIYNWIYCNCGGTTYEDDVKLDKIRKIVEQALIKAQEQEKALEILKEKEVEE